MYDASLLYRFGISLALGFLVGFQREFAFGDQEKDHAAGVRTFSALALGGCTAAFLSDLTGSPWVLVVSIFSFSLFFAVNYFLEASKGNKGLTSEVSAMVVLLIGALCYHDQVAISIAIGIMLTVLLSVKAELHRFAGKITRSDLSASLKFAVIAAIVLPVLPNESYGVAPFDIFNPFKIWMLVVFISGISFVGFILIKIVGTQRGIGLTGLLGGIASSTAVTLSFTQRSRQNPALAPSFSVAIFVAWTVMFVRVVLEVGVVNHLLVAPVLLPLGMMMATGLLYCLVLWRYQGKAKYKKENLEFNNPFELGPAIKFGLIFTAVLALAKAARTWFGDTGLYVSSFVSGLADVDAIALTVAELSLRPDELSLTAAADAVVLAAVANTLSKGMIVMLLGSSALRKFILPGLILMMASGLAAIALV